VATVNCVGAAAISAAGVEVGTIVATSGVTVDDTTNAVGLGASVGAVGGVDSDEETAVGSGTAPLPKLFAGTAPDVQDS
jgi:hypothetical protein